MVQEDNTFYSVTFQDYDFSQIGETQSVLSGSNAIPPENPTRDGYNFTKWEPSFTCVESDLTCVAQYEKIAVPVKRKNHMRNQVVKVQLSKNILSVGDYCFHDCTKLQEVQLGQYCRHVGTGAFRNCTSLTSVSRLNDSNPDHTFDTVGNYAFSNTGIQSATLALRGSSTFTFWGDYCFAYNGSLRSVRFLSSSYMSNNMFCGCSALTSVTFDNNYTSYVYPYVFRDCTGLSDITLPSNIWFISNGMFKGCTSLSSVGFSKYKNTKIDLVQDSAFSGCSSLTSIEFPDSLSSLSSFEDGCFQNMPNLAEITFDGLATKDIVTQDTKSISDDIYYGKVYFNRSDTQKIIDCAYENHIPIVFCLGNDGESFSTLFKRYYSEKGQYVNQIKKIKCIFVYGDQGVARETIKTEGEFGTVNHYVVQIVKFKQTDGTVKTYKLSTTVNRYQIPPTLLTAQLKKWGYDYELTEQTAAFRVNRVVETISKTGCFRLNHDCTLISMDGTRISFKYDPGQTEQKIEEPSYESDASTMIDFETGKWYYNMKQLKEHADQTGKPILGIYSFVGCKPCTTYHDNVWNNENLQSWISSQNFYFCGIESERQMYYDDQLYYCVKGLAPNANNFIKYQNYQGDEDLTNVNPNAFGEWFHEIKNQTTGLINTDLYPPIIIFYGPKDTQLSNQFYLYSYHNISEWLMQCGKDGVVEILKRLCLYHFEGNDVTSPNGFVKGVTEKFDKDNLPTKEQQDRKYSYYDAETNTVTLATYQNLENLKQKFRDTFRESTGEYVGGCQVEDFQWMVEIGIDTDTATLYPNEMKLKFESVSRYVFSEVEQYSLSVDLDDAKEIYSPCSVEAQLGYRMIWTAI